MNVNSKFKQITLMKNLFLLLAGLLIVSLNACKDDEGDPAPDENNLAPLLEVSEDIVGMTGETYSISANASDPDGDALEYSWEIIETPQNSEPTLVNSSNENGAFSTEVAGTYKVEIKIDDGRGGTASEVVTLYIGGILPAKITSDLTLPDLFDDEDIPEYYITQGFEVEAGLTIEPGVVIEVGSDIRVWISTPASYLKAIGTASKNITFRGITKARGSWRAIGIYSSNVNNVLDHVNIMHAGSSETGESNYKAKTTIFVKSNVAAKLSISNTNITESGGHGLVIDGNLGSLTIFENNTISNNETAPLVLGANNLNTLDHNSVFENNSLNAIIVPYGNFETETTVKELGVPYHFTDGAMVATKVTFEPGVINLFGDDQALRVNLDGAIVADGTADKPIVFSGISKVAGAWRGIEIHSPSPLNAIDHGQISYGGSTSGRDANIYMFGSSPGSRLVLTNSTISHSATYGISKAPGSVELIASDNIFSNNSSGDMKE